MPVKCELQQNGFSIVRGALDPSIQQDLIAILGSNSSAGRRGVLGLRQVRQTAESFPVLQSIRPYFQSPPFPVRAIYFDKSGETNWMVSWHQDLTIAVRERIELAGFSPWSVKDGVTHVQPPVEVLERMLTVRLHLDNADESNGALRVLPGSHQYGRLSAGQIRELRTQHAEVVCVTSAGDALLMRPLLLHASSRSTSPRPRRILHIEYADFELPSGLRWEVV